MTISEGQDLKEIYMHKIVCPLQAWHPYPPRKSSNLVPM